MTNDRSNDRINRDDLFTMMASYKNMIETNLMLIEKQETVSKNLVILTDLLNKLNGFVTDNLSSFDRHHTQCAINQKVYNDDLKALIKENRLCIDKSQMSQNVKIFGLITLFCSIILSLIGLVYKLWPSTLIKP